jgi:nucleoid DNA-binding protein
MRSTKAKATISTSNEVNQGAARPQPSREKGTMTKAEMVKAVAEEAGITQAQADKAISATCSAILAGTLAGEKVTVPGFGTFDLKETEAREGRNPATGAPLTIAAKKTLKFKISKPVEDRINGK